MDYVDDPSISDDTEILRLVKCIWIVSDDNNPGKCRLSSQAFEYSSDGPTSILLSHFLEEQGRLIPNCCTESHPYLVKVLTAFVRAFKCGVCVDPERGKKVEGIQIDPAHGFLLGPGNKQASRGLRNQLSN